MRSQTSKHQEETHPHFWFLAMLLMHVTVLRAVYLGFRDSGFRLWLMPNFRFIAARAMPFRFWFMQSFFFVVTLAVLPTTVCFAVYHWKLLQWWAKRRTRSSTLTLGFQDLLRTHLGRLISGNPSDGGESAEPFHLLSRKLASGNFDLFDGVDQ